MGCIRSERYTAFSGILFCRARYCAVYLKYKRGVCAICPWSRLRIAAPRRRIAARQSLGRAAIAGAAAVLPSGNRRRTKNQRLSVKRIKTSIAVFIETDCAFPCQAISIAVPWSTDVRRTGNPNVADIVRSKSYVLAAMCPWSW